MGVEYSPHQRSCPNEILMNNQNYVSFKGQHNVAKVNRGAHIALLKIAIAF